MRVIDYGTHVFHSNIFTGNEGNNRIKLTRYIGAKVMSLFGAIDTPVRNHFGAFVIRSETFHTCSSRVCAVKKRMCIAVNECPKENAVR